MTPTLFALLLADIILAASGQLLLKKGMLIIGPLDFALKNIPQLLTEMLKNGYIWVALIFYGVSMIFWLFILSNVKLSFAYPSLSIVYVLVVLGSWIFFREAFAPTQAIGMGLILIGIVFLFYTR